MKRMTVLLFAICACSASSLAKADRDPRSDSSDSSSTRDHRGSSDSFDSSGSTLDSGDSEGSTGGGGTIPIYWQDPRLDIVRLEIDSFLRRVDGATASGVGGRIIVGNRYTYFGGEIAGGATANPELYYERLMVFGVVGGVRAPLSPNLELGVEGFFGGHSFRKENHVMFEGRLKAQYRVRAIMSIGGYAGANIDSNCDGAVVGFQIGFHDRQR